MALSGFIICVDQATKLYIHSQFMHGESISVIQNFFNITYVRNTVAFGFLRDANETLRTVFLSVPPIAAIIIFFMLRATPKEDIVSVLSSLRSRGAIGNYIDRLRYGFVVDFLDFHYYGQISWPVFNGRHSIVTGIALMILLELRRPKALAAKGIIEHCVENTIILGPLPLSRRRIVAADLSAVYQPAVHRPYFLHDQALRRDHSGATALDLFLVCVAWRHWRACACFL